jgi:hypothetical protein
MSSEIRARVLLCALAALFVAAAIVPPLDRIPAGSAPASGVDDGALYERVVARVRSGDSYYPAMGEELTKRNYPTGSVFNWRTPMLFRLMALAPPAAYFPVLALLSLVVLASAVIYLNRAGGAEVILLGVLALVGALMAILAPANRFQTEGWAGLLMVMSVLLYARSAWKSAALTGLAALFVRELAAPYCVVCVLLAARARRGRELAIWFGGAAAYAGFYWWHVVQVAAQARPGRAIPMASWVQLGGLRFLMETIQQSNSAMLLAPYIVSACAVTLFAAALWAPAAPPHLKGVVIAYALFFSVVGQSFNDYWGLTPAPTFALAVAYGPSGIRALVLRAVGRPRGGAASRSTASA